MNDTTPNAFPHLDPVAGLHAALVAGGLPFATRAMAEHMLAQGETAYSVRVRLQHQREAEEEQVAAALLAAESHAATAAALDPALLLSARLDAWQRGQAHALLAAQGLPARRDAAAPHVAAVPAGELAAVFVHFLRAA